MTIYAWSIDAWDPKECYCGGSPPPTFQVPPPPQPPSQFQDITSGMERSSVIQTTHCEEFPITCSATAPEPQEKVLPVTIHVPLFLVIAAITTLVILIIIATTILYRLRHCFWTPKGCQHVSSLKMYGDLSSYKHPDPSQKSQRLRPSRDSILGIQLCQRTNHTQQQHDHLYQSISSGSDTCSYTTSEATPCHRRAQYPLPHMYSHTDTDNEENIQLHNSSNVQPAVITSRRPSKTYSNVSDGNYSNFNVLESNIPNSSKIATEKHFILPCATCGLLLSPNDSTGSTSPNPISDSSKTKNNPSLLPKNSYYMNYNHTESISLSPQERGLPPLPSRSPRFKAYFIPDHLRSLHRNKNNRLGRQKREKMCQCKPSLNQNVLEKSPHLICKHKQKESKGESNLNKFGDAKIQDKSKKESNNLTYITPNIDNSRVLNQYFNEISVANSKNQHKYESEPLYENCNDA